MKKQFNPNLNFKIGLVLAVVLAGFIGIIVANLMAMNKIKAKSSTIKDVYVEHALLGEEMRFNVVEVQQWLTDYALTGRNDGLGLAQKYRDKFLKEIKIFKSYFEEADNKEFLEKSKSIESNFNDFYKLGLEMAGVYLNQGRDTGNIFMEKFDPYVNKLLQDINELVEYKVGALNTANQEMNTMAAKGLKTTIFIGMISMLIVMLVGFFIFKSLLTPIRTLRDNLKNIASGEGDLTLRLPVTSKDEVGEMAQNFNLFIEKIQMIVQKLYSQLSQVTSSVDDLKNYSRNIGEGAGQAAEKSISLASSIEQSNAGVNGISAGAEEMSITVSTVASAIEEMSASLNEVAKSCHKELEIATRAESQSKTVLEIISRLEQSANQIGKVIDVISKIASQTDLLALNATIEAASAGESGKGFAVVANEVKDLAKKTAQATEEIVSLINEIRKNTDESVKSIQGINGVIGDINTISHNIVSAVEEQSSTINEISGNVAGASQAATEISRNIQEISTGIGEISKNMLGVTQVVEESATGVQKIEDNASNLFKFAQDLSGIVKSFKF